MINWSNTFINKKTKMQWALIQSFAKISWIWFQAKKILKSYCTDWSIMIDLKKHSIAFYGICFMRSWSLNLVKFKNSTKFCIESLNRIKNFLFKVESSSKKNSIYLLLNGSTAFWQTPHSWTDQKSSWFLIKGKKWKRLSKNTNITWKGILWVHIPRLKTKMEWKMPLSNKF